MQCIGCTTVFTAQSITGMQLSGFPGVGAGAVRKENMFSILEIIKFSEGEKGTR